MAVTINTFFLLLSLMLLAIFIFFKPMNIDIVETSDTAMLELQNFKLYDIGSEGLTMMLKGSFGKRYRDRYEVRDINYTSSAAQEEQQIAAAVAVYKDHILYLNGRVLYKKGDTFMFQSDEARYNERTHTALTTGAFELKNSEGIFKGYALHYNSEANTIKAKRVHALYYINKAG